MDLTLEILYYKLLIYIQDNTEILLSLQERPPLVCCNFYHGQVPGDDILYIVSEDCFVQYTTMLEGCSVVVLGTGKPVNNFKGDMIRIDSQMNLMELSDLINRIFCEFRQWKDRVQTAVYEYGDLQQILDASHDFISALYLLPDNSFNILAYTNELFSKFPEYINPPKSIPIDLVNNLFDDPEFAHADMHHEVFEYPTMYLPDRVHCYNIFIHGKYYARIILQGAREEYLPGRACFLGILGKMLDQYFIRRYDDAPVLQEYLEFQEMIAQFVRGAYQDRNQVNRLLSRTPWRANHQFRVICFQFEQTGYTSYYCRQIEQTFPNCCTVFHENKIYCVVNDSLSIQEETERWEKLFPYFLRDNLCKAGLSDTFHDIYQIYTYCIQANVALEIGLNQGSHLWYYTFEDHAMQYIKQQITSQLPASVLVHPAIHKLKIYDEKNNTQLLETLHQLIDCKYNVSHTAERMYVHRTTLLQRLERIERLTGVNLQDYNQRLHLMLSYFIMPSQL